MPARQYIQLRTRLDRDEQVLFAARVLGVGASDMIGLLYIVLQTAIDRCLEHGLEPRTMFASRHRHGSVTRDAPCDLWANKSGLTVALQRAGILTDTGWTDIDRLANTGLKGLKMAADRARRYRERRKHGPPGVADRHARRDESGVETSSPPHTPPYLNQASISSNNLISKSNRRAKKIAAPAGCWGKTGHVFYDPERASFVGITAEDLAAWAEAYPAVNLDLFLKDLAQWIKSHPKRGRRANYRSMITNNLSWKQDRNAKDEAASRLIEPSQSKYENLPLFSDGKE